MTLQQPLIDFARIIQDWIREDLPINCKIAIYPKHVTSLVAALTAAQTPIDVSDSSQTVNNFKTADLENSIEQISAIDDPPDPSLNQIESALDEWFGDPKWRYIFDKSPSHPCRNFMRKSLIAANRVRQREIENSD